MKRGSQYARKLKQAYAKFRGCAGARTAVESTDAIEQLIVAVLSQETTTNRAKKAVKQINEDMVDYNELRVSTPAEISRSIGRYVPRSVQRAKILIRLLNAIYQQEYAVSFNSLASKGVRDIKSYLENLDGITPYVSASILLWSLGGHAIPINDPALEFLRKQGLVEPGAGGAEVQSFLERHISAADAKSFCLDLEAYVAAKSGSAREARRRTDGQASSRKTAAPRRKTKGRAATSSETAGAMAKAAKTNRKKRSATR